MGCDGASMTEDKVGAKADELIHWILDHKVAKHGFDKVLNQQTIDITPLGIDVNAVLNKLKTDSKEAEETNIAAAETLANCEWCDHDLESHTQEMNSNIYRGDHLGCQHAFCSCVADFSQESDTEVK